MVNMPYAGAELRVGSGQGLAEPRETWRIIYRRTGGVLRPRRVIAEDLQHGGAERRYFCFGRVGNGVLTVRFTYRAGRIRIFGAGFWRKGKKIYEQQNG